MSYFRSFAMTPELQKIVVGLTAEQEVLRKQIVTQPLPSNIHTIAGCDSAFIGDTILSIFVILSFPELEELEVQFHASKVTLPYIPGFLSFREIPNLVATYEKVIHKPDVIMVDGQGILHPRRMGIATQLGITLQKPTVGVAKSKLTGTFIMPGESKGDYTPISDRYEQLGYVLRSKEKVKPIFVSPGHRCDLPSALELVQATLRKHKLPEPTRLADKYSKEYKPRVTGEIG